MGFASKDILANLDKKIFLPQPAVFDGREADDR